MKKRSLLLVALVSVMAMTSSAFGQLNITGPQPTVAGQIGTSAVQRNLDVNDNPLLTKRVGVIAYCADIAPNAADAGIFGREEFEEGKANWINFNCPECLRNPILDATTIGYLGAQNIVDMIMYDDGIPRFKDVVLIDGDRELPTADKLIQNFDCVIAYTDNGCGVPIPTAIANSAAGALSTFAQTPGKGVVLTGFAFNTQIGFGNALFNPNLSPIRKASTQVDVRCSPPDNPDPLLATRGACPIGHCPENAYRQFPAGFVPPQTGLPVTAPECFTCVTEMDDPNNPGTMIPTGCSLQDDPAHDGLKICADASGAFCGGTFSSFVRPVFTPLPPTTDRVCESLFEGVNGPTSASFANALTEANVNTAQNATLCANYDTALGTAALPLIAVNATRNVVALNVFPAYSEDLKKTWFSCILANAAIYACGERRCKDNGAGGTVCR